MKLLIVAICALACLFLVLPASAQLIGPPIADLPQHVVGASFGCDGNGQCSGGAFFSELMTGKFYNVNSVDLIPNFVPTPSGKTVMNITPTLKTGLETPIFQQDRLTVSIGMDGGSSIATARQPSYNFTTGERLSAIFRLNKTLNTDAGKGNWYLGLTGFFTQIMGVPNGQTWALRLSPMHSFNGAKAPVVP